ncbi:hypothetical protein [Saccharopolyspora pogona]|uniref:hypothetical protein n=1 Tax=Saccharopolyspora pogona TaxID=333966 RepID=UPI0016821F71|nr:hypothetical protein [Saccharopolyspora pogona]
MVRQKEESGEQESAEEGEKSKKKLDLSPTQVAGAALASVTAAFLGSRLGVAGTMLGAALTSVVITVGGAFYQRSFDSAKEKAVHAAAKASEKRFKRTTVARFVSKEGEKVEATRHIHLSPDMHWPGGETVVDEDRTAKIDAEAATRMLSWSGTEQASEVVETQRSPDRRKLRTRWVVVAASCSAAFVLSMLIVTGVEGVTGKPLSGGDGGTTLGQVLHRDPQPTPSTPAKPRETPSEQPQPSTEVKPTQQPAEQPTTEAPAPTQQPTQAPTSTEQPGQAPASGVVDPRDPAARTGELQQPTSGR